MDGLQIMELLASCPNNKGHKRFVTTAHVVQDWVVDHHGGFIEEIVTSEVTHPPCKGNAWTCRTCGAEATVVEVV